MEETVTIAPPPVHSVAGRPECSEDAGEIDVQQAVPGLVVHFPDAPPPQDPGVRNTNVEAPPGLQSPFREPLDLHGEAHVHLADHRIATGGPNLRDGLHRIVLVTGEGSITDRIPADA
jgi:hypothetical protein